VRIKPEKEKNPVVSSGPFGPGLGRARCGFFQPLSLGCSREKAQRSLGAGKAALAFSARGRKDPPAPSPDPTK